MTKKIYFFIARYSISGVPLAQIRLAKSWQRRGYQVEFVIGYVPHDLLVPVIEGINVVNLDVQRTYKLLLPIFSIIRSNRPDVIFTAEDHLNAVVTLAVILAGSKAKLSASSRVTPYDTYSNKLFSKRWILKCCSIFLRTRVDALVCVSEDMVKQYEDVFGRANYQCIYNVICDADMPRKISEPLDEPWLTESPVPIIITAGRLAPEKGFFDLILAVKELAQRIEVRLAILGDGPLRADLEALIKKHGLTDCVRLLGFKDNPLKYFSRSKVFVLSSYVEGLPNVLVEGMACGCTPVATDCPTGPREVLQDGKYGYLVPMSDPVALALAIEKALANPMTPALLGEAIAPFTEDQVIRRHQSVLGI